MVGDQVRAVRTQRGLTVGALAEKCGLSKGLISQVENGKTSPSITTLERIAAGLGVPAAYLLLRPEQRVQVVRAGERTQVRYGPDRLKLEWLTTRSSRQLKAVLVEMEPGSSSGDPTHAHKGEEFHLVLEGQVRAEQGGDIVTLKAGDAFHWFGCIPHRVVNVGDSAARVLVVTFATEME